MNSRAVPDATLRSFLDRIASVRSEITRVVLFGSRARGDARPDSDYDLLLVVPRKTALMREVLYDAVLDTLLDTGRLISLKIFRESEFARLNELRTPFMMRVQQEGIPIG
jgi:predicted nucleotidyltransferase